MCEHNVIRKTDSTKHIATEPEQDNATAIGSTHKNW